MRDDERRPANLNRRELVLGVSGCAALSLTGSGRGLRNTPLGTVLGAGLVEMGGAERNVFSTLDLDDASAHPRITVLDFYGHGVALDPLDAKRIAVFEKKGDGACLIDLGTREVIAPIETHPDREFYGHGAFSSEGDVLFTTESIVSKRYKGVIVVRDARTMQELGEFPSYGASPHDIVLRDGGKTLVVTNGGGRRAGGDQEPCVSYVDVPSQKLIERVEVAHPDVGSGHLALTSRGDLALVAAARGAKIGDGLGAVSFRPFGGALRSMAEPASVTGRMRGEALSVAIHEPSGTVGVTSPFGGLVTFWNLERGELLHVQDLAFPRGIALSLDGSRFVVSYGRACNLIEIATDTLRPISGSRRTGLYFFGSHLVTHALA